MLQNELFLRILITIVMGAILGLETETRAIEIKGKQQAKKEASQKIGGLRTYTILSLFGGIAGIFYLAGLNEVVYILFFTVILFTLAAYILNVQLKKAFGLTTEIAIVITFALGFMTTSGVIAIQVVLLIIVLMTFFLSQKRGIGAAIQKIQHKEVIDVLKFGLISIAILPLLPNQDFHLGEVVRTIDPSSIINPAYAKIVLINPFQIWLLVVIISGINLLGYVLSKFLGKNKGVFFAGVFGGIVSSTSTVISLAIKSKDELKPSVSKLLAGVAIISNSVSFISIAILLFATNKILFKELIPVMVLIFASGLILGLVLIRNEGKELKETSENLGLKYKPFSIGPAVKFVSLIIIIKFVIQFLQILNVSSTVFIIVSSLSGLTGMDSAVIAFGDLVNSSAITLTTGVIAFMLANYINFLGKSMYSLFLGERKYFYYLTAGLLFVGLVGIIGILL